MKNPNRSSRKCEGLTCMCSCHYPPFPKGANIPCEECQTPTVKGPSASLRTSKETAEEIWSEKIADCFNLTDDDNLECDMEGVKQILKDYKRELLEDLKKKLPKKRMTCDCDDSGLGYHGKDCDFTPYGFNEAIDRVIKIIDSLYERI